jgi:hypothetical protein
MTLVVGDVGMIAVMIVRKEEMANGAPVRHLLFIIRSSIQVQGLLEIATLLRGWVALHLTGEPIVERMRREVKAHS